MALLKKRKSCERTHDLINMNHTRVGYKLSRSSVFFLDEISSNFNLKNMISTYAKDISRKKWL